jgi:hypothetical protein
MKTLEEYIPATLEEAINYLINKSEPGEVEKLMGMSREKFMGNVHHFLGQSIRNDWNLWWNEKNNPLTDYFTSLGINHGDDRSGMILNSLFNVVNGKPIDIEGQVAHTKAFWAKKENGEFPGGIVPAPTSFEEWEKKHKKK